MAKAKAFLSATTADKFVSIGQVFEQAQISIFGSHKTGKEKYDKESNGEDW